MKAICARKELYQGIQAVSRAIAGRSAWPILNNILIRSDGDSLRLTAFDLELGMECSVPAHVLEEGSLTVPARPIAEVLGSLPEADVQLSVDEQNAVSIRCEKSDYVLLGLPPEEFRTLPDIPEERGFDIAEAALGDMIKQSVFAVSPDESTAILTGVLLVLKEDGIKLVSTDRNRLTIHTAPLGGARGEATCIVPRRALDEVSRLLGDEDTAVKVAIADSQIKFVVDGVTIISRLIEGQFPNYERVMPTDCTRKLTISTEQLLSSVKRASIVARENMNRIMLRTSGDQLIITAESGEVGRAHEELDVVREGDDIEVAFNSRFLVDYLGVVDAEGICMELTEPMKPVLIRPVGFDDYQYVLMPLQPVHQL